MTQQRPDLMTSIMVACMLFVTALVAKRELFGGDGRPTSVARASIDVSEHWPELIAGGHESGPASAPAVLVVFTDLECPACREFELLTLRAVRGQFPDSVRVIYRHWPLPYHRFANPAAVAAECAGEQGRFMPFLEATFSSQDSLGLLSFTVLASRVPGLDTLRFGSCLQDPSSRTPIDRDVALITSLEARGTPTVILGGALLGFVPDSVRLRDLIIGTFNQSGFSP